MENKRLGSDGLDQKGSSAPGSAVPAPTLPIQIHTVQVVDFQHGSTPAPAAVPPPLPIITPSGQGKKD